MLLMLHVVLDIDSSFFNHAVIQKGICHHCFYKFKNQKQKEKGYIRKKL